MEQPQDKSFRRIISEKEYYALKESEKYDFLIEKKIFYGRNEKEIKKQHIEDEDKKQVWFLEEYYSINPIIIKKLISRFLVADRDYSEEKAKIKLELINTLNEENTLDYHYNIYNENLKQCNLEYSSFYNEYGFLNGEKLKVFIEKYIRGNGLKIGELLYYFGKLEIRFKHIRPFSCIIPILKSMEMLRFLKTYSDPKFKYYLETLMSDEKRVKGSELKTPKIKDFSSFFKNNEAKYIDLIKGDFTGINDYKKVAYLFYVLQCNKVLRDKVMKIQFFRSIKNDQVSKSDEVRYNDTLSGMSCIYNEPKDEEFKKIKIRIELALKHI